MKTEEEQVEALKNWWKENGKSLILTIAVSIGGVLSWNAYQDYQVQQSEVASAYFQRLLNSAPAGELSEKDAASIRHNSDLLKTEFSTSTYAQLAALNGGSSGSSNGQPCCSGRRIRVGRGATRRC